MDGGNVGTSAPATLLGEKLTRLVEAIESADPGRRPGLPDDGESLRTLVEALPRLVNAAALAFVGLADIIEALEPAETTELVTTAFSRLDGARVAEAVNAFSRVNKRLYESDPELLAESGMKATADIIEALDFGALRKCLTYRTRARTDYRRRLIAAMGEQPVGLINLVGLLPEYANSAIGLAHQLLDLISFPPEMTTYAALQVVEEVDWAELSETLNSAFKLVNNLERGDLILGDGSSTIADSFGRLSEDFVRGLDLEAASSAVSGLSENLEAVITSLLTAALETEEGALAAGGALLAVSNLFIRGVAAALDALAALPPEALARLRGEVREGLATRELGAALNSSLALFNRAAGGGERALPETMAAVANDALASFNRLSEDDLSAASRGIDSFLAALDSRRVEEAARTVSAHLADAALRRPEIFTALARALLSGALRFSKGYLKNIWTGRRRGVRR